MAKIIELMSKIELSGRWMKNWDSLDWKNGMREYCKDWKKSKRPDENNWAKWHEKVKDERNGKKKNGKNEEKVEKAVTNEGNFDGTLENERKVENWWE